jgi:molybdopterin-binding protein
MKISARNPLPGMIEAVNRGAINAEVAIDIGGATVVAVVANDSVQRLGLAAGKRAYAVVEATDVMVATD